MELLRLALAVVDLVRESLAYRSAPRVFEVHHYHHHELTAGELELEAGDADEWEPDPDEGELAARVLPDEALWDLLVGYGVAVRDGTPVERAARDVFLELDMRHVESQVVNDA